MKRKRRRKPAPAAPAPATTPAPAAPGDLVAQAERARLAELEARAASGKALSNVQIRDLARLGAKYRGVESISCPVILSDGRPVVTVPAGHSVAVSTDDQLAEVYGVEDRQVRDWKTDHTWPAGQRGPYELRVGLPAFVRSKRERAAGPNDLQLADLELKRIKAETLRMRLQAEQQKGVSEDVRAAVRMVTTAWLRDLKDADEVYAGVLNFMVDRMAKRKGELVSMAGVGQ